MECDEVGKSYRLYLILTFLVFCSGCTYTRLTETDQEPITFTDHKLFGERPEILSENEIFKLSDKQREDFLYYFNSHNKNDIPPYKLVYNYLQKLVSGFNYQGNTYTAEEALRLSGGNCLSLAIITTALARLAKVDIAYQLVDDLPVFEKKGKLIFKGVHIRSVLYDAKTENDEIKNFLGRPYLKIDYFPSGNERFVRFISEPEYIAMYFRNMAAEAMVEGDYSRAYWLVRTSQQYQLESAAAINMMAVIHYRVNNPARAEQIYEYGIRHADDKLSLLKNYRIMLNQMGRYNKAEEISAEIARLDDPSPFHWMQLARGAYDDGNYSDAIRYYMKVNEIAPYLHEGHFGLAKSYYQTGRYRAAEREMRQAMEHAFKSSTKSLYQAKLMMLSELR